MKQPVTFTVDDQSYTISPYLTSDGMKLLTDLVLIVGEPLIRVAVQLKDGKNILESDVDPEKLGALISGLSARLSAEKVDGLFKRILSGTLVGNTSVCVLDDYDTRFMGKYAHLMKLVYKTLGAQYGDFLGGLGGLAKFAKTMPRQ